MVTQEAFLFSGTVAENIAIGRPDASREEIEAAAKAIGAHEFIAPCPTATTPTYASAAAASPPASGSWWRSRARCSPTRRC